MIRLGPIKFGLSGRPPAGQTSGKGNSGKVGSPGTGGMGFGPENEKEMLVYRHGQGGSPSLPTPEQPAALAAPPVSARLCDRL